MFYCGKKSIGTYFRYLHAAVCDPNRNIIIVFGGLTNNGASKEIWSFNVDNKIWTELNVI